MKCSNCKADNESDAFFCHNCGEKLRNKSGWLVFLLTGIVVSIGVVILATYHNWDSDSVRKVRGLSGLESSVSADSTEIVPVNNTLAQEAKTAAEKRAAEAEQKVEDAKVAQEAPEKKATDVAKELEETRRKLLAAQKLANEQANAKKAAEQQLAQQKQAEENARKAKEQQLREEEIFLVVEQNPEFPGGNAAMRKFLSDNMNYPPIAQENGIKGRVTLQFVVDKEGIISQVKVVKGVDPSLDKEAIRVMESMPKWVPGKQNGKPVNVWFTLPVIFKLN